MTLKRENNNLTLIKLDNIMMRCYSSGDIDKLPLRIRLEMDIVFRFNGIPSTGPIPQYGKILNFPCDLGIMNKYR
jgi:hypothetical protein